MYSRVSIEDLLDANAKKHLTRKDTLNERFIQSANIQNAPKSGFESSHLTIMAQEFESLGFDLPTLWSAFVENLPLERQQQAQIVALRMFRPAQSTSR